MNNHTTVIIMKDMMSEFNRQTDNIHHRVIINEYYGPRGVDAMTIETFRTKENVLPFWNFMVKQGKYDHEQYFLDALGGNFYFDTNATISIKDQSGQTIRIEQRRGIIRGGYFFCILNKTGDKILCIPLDSPNLEIG